MFTACVLTYRLGILIHRFVCGFESSVLPWCQTRLISSWGKKKKNVSKTSVAFSLVSLGKMSD